MSGQQLCRIVRLIDCSNWLTLAGLGIATIVAASVIESRGAVIRLKWRQWSNPRD